MLSHDMVSNNLDFGKNSLTTVSLVELMIKNGIEGDKGGRIDVSRRLDAIDDYLGHKMNNDDPTYRGSMRGEHMSLRALGETGADIIIHGRLRMSSHCKLEPNVLITSQHLEDRLTKYASDQFSVRKEAPQIPDVMQAALNDVRLVLNETGTKTDLLTEDWLTIKEDLENKTIQLETVIGANEDLEAKVRVLEAELKQSRLTIAHMRKDVDDLLTMIRPPIDIGEIRTTLDELGDQCENNRLDYLRLNSEFDLLNDVVRHGGTGTHSAAVVQQLTLRDESDVIIPANDIDLMRLNDEMNAIEESLRTPPPLDY
jgi:hypothetical protein